MRANESLLAPVLNRPMCRSVLTRRATRLLARHLLVWTLSLVVVLSNWAFLFPDIAKAAGTEIVVREVGGVPETQTTVSGVPGGFDVHTETVDEQTQTALNSFSKFNIGTGNKVSLYIPDGAQNLLNLVYEETSCIDGILESYKVGRPGVIDGNVYFLNPHGVLIGADGIVNVGALTIVTPTTQFMTDFFGNPSRIGDTLSGNVPTINRQGDQGYIRVEGQINAGEDVKLAADDIEVSGWIISGGGIKLDAGGVLITGTGWLVADASAHPDFDDLVSTGELKNGPIEIVAEKSVTHYGNMTTSGFTV